jgi:hypothetical protein
MNTINPSDYFKHKADVSNLSNAITDKHAEVDGLRRRISETQAHVNDINTKLAIEEREISRPGKLSRGTLSSDQITEHKQSATEMENELTVLNEALTVRNRELSMLQNDFGNKNSQFKCIRERTAEALADQVTKQIVELAGDPIKNLVHAMVASGGKHPDKELFLNKLGVRIRDALCQSNPEGELTKAAWLPNLQEAKQHVEGQLHQLYLAEQAK